jgi:hypothetical protein
MQEQFGRGSSLADYIPTLDEEINLADYLAYPFLAMVYS